MPAQLAMLLAITLMGVIAMPSAAAPATFVPIADNIHNATLKDLGDGSFEITTRGDDPYVFLRLVSGTPTAAEHMLAFEYASPHGTDNLQVYVLPPLDEAHSVTGAGLALSEGWSSHSLDIGPAMGGAWDQGRTLRIDPGNRPGVLIRIRAITLRRPNDREKEMAATAEARRRSAAARDDRLGKYLERKAWPGKVASVSVGAQRITIDGAAPNSPDLLLAEVPLWADITDLHASLTLTQLSGGKFRCVVPRMDGARDRLTSRWAIVKRSAGGLALVSPGRYPDSVYAANPLPAALPRTKKGLGGFGPWGSVVSDLDDLGISSVTVNILLNGLVATTPAPGRTPFEYGGRTWYSQDGYVRDLDKTLAETSRRHIVVSAIILIAQGYNAPAGDWSHIVAHPDAHPSGIFVMPNMDSQEGVLAYAAAMDYLGRRYSRPGDPHGRIHHYILHNEINAGWIWTNAGEKTARSYMDLYHRSMRLAQLVARQYDPHAQAFISLEHHWTYTPEPRFYTGKGLLELLVQYCHAEGDFEWALAHHPYPDSLLEPKTWLDGHTDQTLNTPKITFKNVEVLELWANQKPTWFQGKRPRIIHLTEQGLNSPDYSDRSLREQAAGMAYAWNKIKAMPCIQAFQYHAWLDNRAEFGLRIGLRKFSDEPGDPWGKKPIWYVYQAMGTERESEVLDPYLKVIGISDWGSIRQFPWRGVSGSKRP